MYTDVNHYHRYIKQKYLESEKLYQTVADTQDTYLYCYESMNVYPTFPYSAGVRSQDEWRNNAARQRDRSNRYPY